MGKYVRLATHLRSLGGESWTASFAELEKVLGFPLPPSARKYEAWWQPSGSHTQALAWTDAGWSVAKLDLANPTQGRLTDGHLKAGRIYTPLTDVIPAARGRGSPGLQFVETPLCR